MQYYALLSLHRPLGRSVKLEVPRYCIYTTLAAQTQYKCVINKAQGKIMKFYTRCVDTRDSATRNVLLYLQKKCLPSDKPCDVLHGHWWIVYTDTDIPVAFAGMARSSQWLDAGYLCRAGVTPDYTGNGLQKRLIRVRIAKAKKLNWNWVVTDTTANPASSNSLISQGFRLYEPSVPWAYKHSLYWRLNISKDAHRAVQRSRGKKVKAS